MAYTKDSNKLWGSCLSAGKQGEKETANYLRSKGLEVADTSDLKDVKGDLKVKINGSYYKVEVKTQKAVLDNKIVLEITDKEKYGWFLTDDDVDYYCFHKEDIFLFIKRSELLDYYNTFKRTLNKIDYNGCRICYVNLNKYAEHYKVCDNIF